MILEIERLRAAYGKSEVLHGVDLSVGDGELVALLGRNGAGKTTTLRAVLGLVQSTGGDIRFRGQSLIGKLPHQIARRGLCLVPEHRAIFAQLTVEENLRIAARQGGRWGLAEVYRLFPRLAERRRTGGGKLSGGEQQMLAIARALVNDPALLLLDEPTEGLAPVIVAELRDTLAAIKREGTPILLVEQNIAVCLALADRHVIVELGRTVHSASSEEFLADEAVRRRYLTLEDAA